MSSSAAFWRAFQTGLAGPMSIYNAPPPYWNYVGGYSVAQTFALVGSTMSYTAGGGYGGQPTGWVTTGASGSTGIPFDTSGTGHTAGSNDAHPAVEPASRSGTL